MLGGKPMAETRESRESEWRNLRPINYLMSAIDPRSVYPSYPEGPFIGDSDDEK